MKPKFIADVNIEKSVVDLIKEIGYFLIMKEKLLERIEINPQIMMGKPVIKGTRLPVEIILEKLAYGCSEEDILQDYPFLTKEDIRASLLYAAKILSLEEEYVISNE